MKRKDTISEVRGKDSAELVYDLDQARKALFQTKVQLAGESTDTMQARGLRRKVARIMTVLREREDLLPPDIGAPSEES